MSGTPMRDGGAGSASSYSEALSTLKLGSTGNLVKELQQALGITADGVFGKQTLAAVEAFQKKHGLTVDGIVGSQTWGSLGFGAAVKGGNSSGGAPAAPASAKQSSSQSGGYTAHSFAVALLSRLGVPATGDNIQAIVAWEAAEGGHWNNSARFNPLNTTLAMPGSGTMNSVGVRVYTSWEQGLDATVKTLENGRYAGILNALRAGNDAVAVAHAVVTSPWGTQSINVNGNYVSYGSSPGGAGGGGGGASSGGGGGSQPASANVLDYLDANYGYLAAFLKDPEIGPILKQAAADGWSDSELLGALSKTNWWKKTSQSARQWQAEWSMDPATAKQQLAAAEGKINALAHSLGVNLDPHRTRAIASASIAFGWSDLQLQGAVASEFKYKPGKNYTGEAGQDIAAFKQMANSYLVPLSDKTIGAWLHDTLAGKTDAKGYQAYLAGQAKNLFHDNHAIVKAIDSGQTVDQFLDPYRQLAAQTLEVDPNSIDWMQPKWMKAINQVDPKTGARAPMALGDWATTMRTDPTYGYDLTQNARNEAAQMNQQLLHSFGYIG